MWPSRSKSREPRLNLTAYEDSDQADFDDAEVRHAGRNSRTDTGDDDFDMATDDESAAVGKQPKTFADDMDFDEES